MPLALSDDSDSEGSVTAPAPTTRRRTRSASHITQGSGSGSGSQHDQSQSEFYYTESGGTVSDTDSERGLGSWTVSDGQKWQRENGQVDGPGSYEFETIIRWRRHPRRGFPQYRATWTMYNLYGNTWEPEKNFKKGQLEEFWEREGGRPESVPWQFEYDTDGDPIDPPSISQHSSDTDNQQWSHDPVKRKKARKKLRMYLRADKPLLRTVRAQRHAAAQRRKAEEDERRRLRRLAKAKKASSTSSSSTDSMMKRPGESSKSDDPRAIKKARLETSTTRPALTTAASSSSKIGGTAPAAARAVRTNATPSSAATMTAKDRIQAKRKQDAAKTSSGGSTFPIGKDASAAAREDQKKAQEEAERLERQKKALQYITAAPRKGAAPVTDFKKLGKPTKPKPKFDPLGLSGSAGPSKPAGSSNVGASKASEMAKRSTNKPPAMSVTTQDLSSLSPLPVGPSPVLSASSTTPTATTPVDAPLKSPTGPIIARPPPPKAIRSSADPRRRQLAPPAPAVPKAPDNVAPEEVRMAKSEAPYAKGVPASDPASAPKAVPLGPAPAKPTQKDATPQAPPIKQMETITVSAASTPPLSDASIFAPTPDLDEASRAEGIQWATTWGFAGDGPRRRHIARAYNVVLHQGDDQPEIFNILHSVIRVLGGGFKLRLEPRFWERPGSNLLLWIPAPSWPLPPAAARAKQAPNVTFMAYEGEGIPRPVFGDAKQGFVGLTVSALLQCLQGSQAPAPDGATLVLHPWHRKLLIDAFDEGAGQQLVQYVGGCDSTTAAERAANLLEDLEGKIESLGTELEIDEAHLGWEDVPDVCALDVEEAVRQTDDAMVQTMRLLQAKHSNAKHHILLVGPVTALDLDRVGVSWIRIE